METETPPNARRSAVWRFLESFFQDRNIKWMLGVGTLLLLGSSLMLVTSHWTQWTPAWKYLVLLGYTAASHLAGRTAYFRLGLRRTGTVLMALTVLLIPVNFLALHWVHAAAPHAGLPLARLGLLALGFAFSASAARRIFAHFLRGTQPTFLGSYLLLCLAGTLAPVLSGGWPLTAILVTWAVFTAGTVKASRRVFWLVEERRAPRIFGFFPTALLGAQWLALVAAIFAPRVSADWMGLAVVLAAAPILLTTDAAARVFEARTGGLVRPLPRSIILPLGLAAALSAAGVALAATGLAGGGNPQALVPAAAAAAALMALTAARTRKGAFTWAALAALVIAYNFSPVYFLEAARWTVRQGAQALRENALPYPFYGLTYLPLIAAATALAAVSERKRWPHFQVSLQRFAVGTSLVLLAAAFGHAKALFPVAAAMTLVFAAQAVLFRDRRLAIAAIAASATAAGGFVPFAPVLSLHLPPAGTWLPFSAFAAVLFLAGFALDRRIAALPWRGRSGAAGLLAAAEHPCHAASLVLGLGLAAAWLLRFGFGVGGAAWPAAAVIAGLLAAQALRWPGQGLGEAALVFAGAAALVSAVEAGAGFAALITPGTLALLGLRLASHGLGRHPGLRLSRAFAEPAWRVSGVGLPAALAFIHLPLLCARLFEARLPVGAIPAALPAQAAIIAWALFSAERERRFVRGVLASAGALALAGSAFLDLAGTSAVEWLPAVVAGTAGLGSVAAALIAPRLGTVRRSVREVALLVTWIVGLLTVGVFTWPLRAAGAVAVLGLLSVGALERSGALRRVAALLGLWQAQALAMTLFSAGGVVSLTDLFSRGAVPAALPVALLASAGLLLPRFFPRSGFPLHSELETLHRSLLGLGAALALAGTLGLRGLSGLQVLLALAAFALLVFQRLRTACRERAERAVWQAEVLVLAAVAYLAWFGVITFGHGVSQYLILASAVLLWALGRSGSAILSGPLLKTALVLPLAAAALGIGRHLLGARGGWLGLNSLAVLLAAGFYFWRGLEGREKRLLVLAAAIANAALALLWNELEWSDPQLYLIPLGASVLALVEVLKREIPRALHDPLRYAGALVILVSPTFHIVEGSWLHLFTLMLVSVATILAAIGMRVRALIYAGTAFLAADVAAMVIRGSIGHPSLLWIAGLALGAGVIGLAAVCENRRETLLQRLRGMAAVLESWD